MFKKYLILLLSLSYIFALDIDEFDEITTPIKTSEEVNNNGTISSDNNELLGTFNNNYGAILHGDNSIFNIVNNDGFFEGSGHNINEFINNGYFLSSDTIINNTFTNTYDGIVEGSGNDFANTHNFGLIYGDFNTFNNFINYYDGWIFGDNLTFNGEVLNESNSLISGSNLIFNGKVTNSDNSYIFVGSGAEFNEVVNESVIDGSNITFNGEVHNNDTINGDNLIFNATLNNNLESTISGETMEFQKVFNNSMILGDYVNFKDEVENYEEGWIIGNEITFTSPTINKGDIIGARLHFQNSLENHLNLDCMYSDFQEIKNYDNFSAYKSHFAGKITQFNNAYLYANASFFSNDLDGGDYEIAYSKVVNNSINARNFLASHTLLNSTNMNFDSLNVVDNSQVYGGFRTKKLYAKDSEFVVYFNDGFSGSIVVTEEINGENNSIKILNYDPSTGFYPILLAKTNKDIMNDFSLYTIKGFSVFGFDKELVAKINQNGAFLLGIGDFNSLGISDINELFKDEYKNIFENVSKDRIYAFDSALNKVGVDRKIIANIKDKFYKNELLNYAILRLNFDDINKDSFNYEYHSGDINDDNYQMTLLKFNKFNDYFNVNNNLGFFLYKLDTQNTYHKIKGGGIYANFDFKDYYINTDFKYSEHTNKVNLDDFGILDSKYFHANTKLEFGLIYDNLIMFKPNIAMIFEYFPKTKFKNKDIRVKLLKQNNLYYKLGFDLIYQTYDFDLAFSSNYYQKLSKQREMILRDGYSKEILELNKHKSLELGIKTHFLLKDNLHIYFDLSKTLLNKDFDSYSFRASLGYSF